jgi:hypothetical protein
MGNSATRVIFLLALFTAPQLQPPKVFSHIDGSARAPVELQGRGVRRVSRVRFTAKLFSQAKTPLRVTMNFFPGVDLIVRWTSVEPVRQPEGLMWKGGVEGEPESRATLSISGKTVTGNINRGNGLIYEIRTAADGQYWVREVAQKDLPGESEPLRPARAK